MKPFDPFVIAALVGFFAFIMLLVLIRVRARIQLAILAVPLLVFFLDGVFHWFPLPYISGVCVGIYEALLLMQAHVAFSEDKKHMEAVLWGIVSVAAILFACWLHGVISYWEGIIDLILMILLLLRSFLWIFGY